MSLKAKEFTKLRNKAMQARKERYEEKKHELIDTLPEIAAKLKDTPMIKGKSSIMGSFFV